MQLPSWLNKIAATPDLINIDSFEKLLFFMK